jgi:diguanylate cyclase (GGDEF)-like protein
MQTDFDEGPRTQRFIAISGVPNAMGIRTRMMILPALLILVGIVQYLVINRAVQRSDENHEWVNHTNETLAVGEAFLGSLRDAETGQRGYLLTLDPKYLEPYHQGLADSRERFIVLRELTSDNARQQQLLQQLETLMQSKFEELSMTIELSVAGRQEDALTLVRSDKGKQLMDRMRTLMDDFNREEQNLLSLQRARYQEGQSAFQRLFLLCALLSVALAAIIWVYAQRTLVRPLSDLARSVRKLSSGSTQIDIEYESRDEIGELVREFKHMNQRLQEQKSDLQNLNDELKSERDKAVKASEVDPLTGAFNRRKLEEIAVEEIRRTQRSGDSIDLYLIDIDYFKQINDLYGHATGDQVLLQITECLMGASRRPTDHLFRIGGEEFLLLSSGQDVQAAQHYAELLRLAVESLTLPNPGSQISEVVTVSIGVVAKAVDEDFTLNRLLKAADQELYRAKAAGRNRISVSGDELDEFRPDAMS